MTPLAGEIEATWSGRRTRAAVAELEGAAPQLAAASRLLDDAGQTALAQEARAIFTQALAIRRKIEVLYA